MDLLCLIHLFGKIKAAFKLLIGMYQSAFFMVRQKPDWVIGVGGYVAATYFVRGYLIPDSMITYLLLAVGAMLVYYTFSFITPFKDTMKIVNFTCEFDASLMKIDVIRDRLEDPYEI